MSRNQELRNKRDQDIRKDFEKLSAKKEKGVAVYSYRFILLKLSEKYYLEERTIQLILSGKNYSTAKDEEVILDENQLDIFDLGA